MKLHLVPRRADQAQASSTTSGAAAAPARQAQPGIVERIREGAWMQPLVESEEDIGWLKAL